MFITKQLLQLLKAAWGTVRTATKGRLERRKALELCGSILTDIIYNNIGSLSESYIRIPEYFKLKLIGVVIHIMTFIAASMDITGTLIQVHIYRVSC
jgi:hypothetical protein